jgi:CheY-like chemotaxis protein
MMPTTKSKLLIVDDDASIRRALSELFTANGYSVRSAEEGSSALTEIQSEVPDIILSDLQMPGMSGFEFLSLVHFQFPTIHLIAMSAAFSGSRVPPGVAADAFYAKGSSLRSLLQTMEAMAESEPEAEPAARPCRSKLES